jgi:branched-chain amino acid transport system permease protein
VSFLVVTLHVLAPAGAAAADAARVDGQAWSQTGAVPTFVASDGRTYVAAALGTEQARSYVDLVGVTPSDAGDLRLELVEAGGDELLPDQAMIAACPLQQGFTARGQVSTADLPPPDCSRRVMGTRTAADQWTIELGAFADRWTAGVTNALVVFPDIAQGSETFRLAFDVARTRLVPAGAAPDSRTAATPEAPVGETSDAALPLFDIGVPPAASDRAPPLLPTEHRDDGGGRATADEIAAPSDVRSAPVSINPVTASTPGAAGVLGAALVLLAIGAVGLRVSHTYDRVVIGWPVAVTTRPVPSVRVRDLGLAAAFGLLALPMLLPDAAIFKVGLVLIAVVAALGLHILVNWAGEFSLAHAAFIGLPAFVVARLSAEHHASPIYLLPLAALGGAIVGAVVALPSIRTRGLQVALVTLATGVAVDRFFFTKPWLVGRSGVASVPTPRLGSLTFATSRSLYPVLAVVVVAAGVGAAAIHHSRLARSFLWMKANPEAASAFGVPVRRYRIMAFALAGAYAGLAGGLDAVWIQRVAAGSFPLTASINYLLFAVLSGPGFIWGVVLAAGFFEAGRLFIVSAGWFFVYAGPIGLIVNVVRYPQGINGMLRSARRRMRGFMMTEHGDRNAPTTTGVAPGTRPAVGTKTVSASLVLGVALVILGFIAIGLAWYHAGNTSEVWVQNQELLSGGVGGLALVIVGLGVLIRDKVGQSHAALAEHLARVLSREAAYPTPDDAGGLEDLTPTKVMASPR